MNFRYENGKLFKNEGGRWVEIDTGSLDPSRFKVENGQLFTQVRGEWRKVQRIDSNGNWILSEYNDGGAPGTSGGGIIDPPDPNVRTHDPFSTPPGWQPVTGGQTPTPRGGSEMSNGGDDNGGFFSSAWDWIKDNPGLIATLLGLTTAGVSELTGGSFTDPKTQQVDPMPPELRPLRSFYADAFMQRGQGGPINQHLTQGLPSYGSIHQQLYGMMPSAQIPGIPTPSAVSSGSRSIRSMQPYR